MTPTTPSKALTKGEFVWEGAVADTRAQELERANAALQAVTDALATARGMDEIIPAVLRIVQRTFGCPGLGYFEHRDLSVVRLRYWLQDGQVLSPAALLALTPDGEHAVIRTLAEGFTVPDAYLGTPITARTRAVTINHRAGTLRPDFDAWCIARGWPMELNVPLVVNGRAPGALVLCRDAVHAYVPAEVALAEALAKQLALAVEAARLADAERAAAVAREREQAAEGRAAELARINEALRGGVARLVEAPDIEGILDVWVLEAIRLTGAAGGAVLRRVEASSTEVAFVTVAQGEHIIRETIAADLVASAREISRRDPVGFFRRVLSGEKVVITPEELSRWYPVAAEYHRAMGNEMVWHMPYQIGGTVAGYLGLAFSDRRQPDPATLRTLEALALQAGMTTELRQKSEEARQAAVSREKARAAQERAAALADTNQLLQRSIGRLSLRASPEEFVRPFLEEMYALLDADSAAQFRVDEAAGTLTGWAYYDQGRWAEDSAFRQARIVEIPAWAEIITHPGQPTVFDLLKPADRARVYPDSVRFLDERGSNWLVNLPLVVDGRVDWVLAINGGKRERLTAENLEVFTTLARQLTLALELHRLGEEASSAAVAREREGAAKAHAAELARTNQAVSESLNALVALTDLRPFLRRVFGQCAQLTDALGGSLFFHHEPSATLRKDLGWIKGQVVDFVEQPDSAYWHEPVPVATIPDWAEIVQIDPQDERVWANARPWHRARGYGWMCRVPIRAGAQAFGFMGMAFVRREDLTPEKAELICAMSHQIALAVQLDRLAGEAKDVALLAERNRIARDLHDGLAQGFVGVLAQTGVLEGALEDGDLQESVRVTERVRAIAREGLEEARRSVHALRPREQADRLFERLRAILAGMTAGTSLQVEATQSGTLAALVDQADWAAVKFVQQALTNTVRYARASSFELTLAWEVGGLTLTARDDGAGFDPELPRNGIGLWAMAERAAECGGTFRVESAAGQGTVLRLFLPAAANFR